MQRHIALLAPDSNYPNLALMRLAAYHRARGDTVEWYTPFGQYDRLYISRIFTFTPDYPYVIANAKEIVKGGTGYDIRSRLAPEVESTPPDYSIYPDIDRRTSYGFLTRGCPNRCPWCVVPDKEGGVRPCADIETITEHGQRPRAILMDNNVLASPYGIEQIHKIAARGYRVDFNQGLDARLVTDDIARLLARVRWIDKVRFGCDTPRQVTECERAIALMRSHGFRGYFRLYCIITSDIAESVARISHWRGDTRILPFAQPYRDYHGHAEPPQWQKDLAAWADRPEVYRTAEFADFRPRKGFRCGEYLAVTPC